MNRHGASANHSFAGLTHSWLCARHGLSFDAMVRAACVSSEDSQSSADPETAGFEYWDSQERILATDSSSHKDIYKFLKILSLRSIYGTNNLSIFIGT